MKETQTLVLGLGNKILSDDGIGVRIVEELRYIFNFPGVHFETACCGGLEIVEMMNGYNEVIIIDAIKTTDGYPGDIYILSPEDFNEPLHISNFHDFPFLAAMELAKVAGMKMPDKIRIIAIKIVEDLFFSEQFSEEIDRQYGAIKKKITHILNSLFRESLLFQTAIN
jgi:hydrogenase maturation protease